MLRKLMKQDGKGIDSENYLIPLIAKRTQAMDCVKNGWILEDFPKTRHQAGKMVQFGLNPSNVFYVRVPHETVYARTI